MNKIGFSSGSISGTRTHDAAMFLLHSGQTAIEVSALREDEFWPMLALAKEIDEGTFAFKSFHAPKSFTTVDEQVVVEELRQLSEVNWAIVVHPDAILCPRHWRSLDHRLSLENMDERKPLARTAEELDELFNEFPSAMLCFDIGHVRQIDPSMCEALEILKRHRNRISHLHVSDVDSRCRHWPLSFLSNCCFEQIRAQIPPNVPIIMETPVPVGRLNEQIAEALQCLAS
jgi:hypothetical protein